MIFRQLFDQVSSTYSDLLASRCGGDALDHPPGAGKGRPGTFNCQQQELDLKLVKAVDSASAC